MRSKLRAEHFRFLMHIHSICLYSTESLYHFLSPSHISFFLLFHFHHFTISPTQLFHSSILWSPQPPPTAEHQHILDTHSAVLSSIALYHPLSLTPPTLDLSSSQSHQHLHSNHPFPTTLHSSLNHPLSNHFAIVEHQYGLPYLSPLLQQYNLKLIIILFI